MVYFKRAEFWHRTGSEMIRWVTARTRLGLVVAAMAGAVPMVSLAQTTESTIESVPVESEGAEVNARSTDDENSTDDDASGQPGSPAGPTMSPAIEVEIQRHINELRSELLDDRAGTVDWWLAALTVVLGFFAIVVVLGGYIGFSRFREIESEAKNSVKTAAEHTVAAERYVREIEGEPR